MHTGISATGEAFRRARLVPLRGSLDADASGADGIALWPPGDWGRVLQ